ncbi:unnamed protein product [Cunninghamella blakesleeana]
MPSYQLLPQVKSSFDFILDYYNNNQHQQPIIVGVSGLPNIGKSTLCHTLSHLFEEEYQLNTTILSLDDHSTSSSLQEKIQLIKYWIQNRTYSIIFIEGTILGYKPLLPNHRLWSLLKKNKHHHQQWERFNQSLYTLESTLYPFLQLFIHLTPSSSFHQKQQFIMHRYYLERLNQFGFFDTCSSSTHPKKRHLSLLLDDDLKLIKKQFILDGTYQQWLSDHHLQQQQLQSSTNGNLPLTHHSNIKKKENLYLRLLRSHPNNQLLASLHPKVLISFAMMSLLGLLGYSRHKISPGDIVLAKLKGFPWWPARNTLMILYHLNGIFSRAKLKPYNAEKLKLDLEKKKLTKNHIEAIEQSFEPNFLDDYFAELSRIRGVKPNKKKKTTTKKNSITTNNNNNNSNNKKRKTSSKKKGWVEVIVIKEEGKEEQIIPLDEFNQEEYEASLQNEQDSNDNENDRKTITSETITGVENIDLTSGVNNRPRRKITKKRYFDDIEPFDDECYITSNNNNNRNRNKSRSKNNNKRKSNNKKNITTSKVENDYDPDTVDSPSVTTTAMTTTTNKKSIKKRKKLSESLVEAANKSPFYERSLYRIYHIRLSIQHLAFKKNQGEILKSDYNKIDQVLKQIEQWPMTLDFLKDTKLYKIIHNISKYEFENDVATYKLRERCLKLLWDWKSNLIDPYLKEMNYESKAASLIDLPPLLNNVNTNS